MGSEEREWGWGARKTGLQLAVKDQLQHEGSCKQQDFQRRVRVLEGSFRFNFEFM